jgi:hypothetical protein
MKSLQLAEKVKTLRLGKAWSQAQLSEISSLSIRTIQRVELDGRCSQETLLALASAFEVDIVEFTSLIKKSIQNYTYYFFGWKFSAPWLKSVTAAVLGAILITPAVYFAGSSILKYGFGISFFFDPLEYFYSTKEILFWFNIFSPLVFLFGLTTSILINLFVMLSVKIWKENSSIHSDISFSPKFANIFISGISFISLAMMFAYVIGENFTLRVH